MRRLSLLIPFLFLTPTPPAPAEVLDVGPPAGWVAAGFLLLLLVFLLYRSFTALSKKLLRKIWKPRKKR